MKLLAEWSRLTTLLALVVIGSALASAQEAELSKEQILGAGVEATPSDQTDGFAGRWMTNYGTLDLKVEGDRVSGNYDLGKVEGKLDGRSLKLTYREKSISGLAEFELEENGQSFRGRWHPDGETEWQEWNGTRAPSQMKFSGLWKMNFGRLRLSLEGQQAIGVFQGRNGSAELHGNLTEENRIEFEFTDGDIVGTGWLRTTKDDELLGAWKPAGGAWMVSEGARVRLSRSKVWLVVLEANWETGLAEPQYAFGPMLKQYFTMPNAKHVQFRHRYFHDLADLKRFCREVSFLAEPVVLLISTHGNPNGITVFNDVITSDELSECMVGLSNVKLLHLSGCAMMASNYPREVQKTPGTNMAISGYTTLVDWDASAIADFTYLTMVLLKQLSPAKASAEAIKASPYIGSDPTNSKLFAPLGLTVLPARTEPSHP
ncbi:MAG: hypothetical protein AAF664_16190 [Planctomycetota bacterium]